MSLCACSQLPDACLSDADGPDGLCRDCRGPGSVCARWRSGRAWREIEQVVEELRAAVGD